jgi:spore maturation protein CgeB
MKIVVFGLTISSSWGNGHATLWRGLCRALHRLGHHVVFYERDVSYYAENRDAASFEGCDLRLYRSIEDVAADAREELATADAAIVTSYCPDGPRAAELVLAHTAGRRLFYDMDTPVTLDRLSRGETVFYLPPAGLGDFDLVLSFTGGRALGQLRSRLGARHVATLYGSVDPDVHRPVPPSVVYRADLSYMGTFAEDRQAAVEDLFLEPARRLPGHRFSLSGSQYPESMSIPDNVRVLSHLPPSEHAAFFCSSRLTLNVTRRAMAELGCCPSGRLFEAAASGVPILSDAWEGLDRFFELGSEILVARRAADVTRALCRDAREHRAMANRARERTLGEHTAHHRAVRLLDILSGIATEEAA